MKRLSLFVVLTTALLLGGALPARATAQDIDAMYLCQQGRSQILKDHQVGRSRYFIVMGDLLVTYEPIYGGAGAFVSKNGLASSRWHKISDAGNRRLGWAAGSLDYNEVHSDLIDDGKATLLNWYEAKFLDGRTTSYNEIWRCDSVLDKRTRSAVSASLRQDIQGLSVALINKTRARAEAADRQMKITCMEMFQGVPGGDLG